MGKRKVKGKTLTKIDPTVLKYKPAAVSQYLEHDGTRVTNTIHPTRRPPVPSADTFGFDLDPANLNSELLEDNLVDEDTSKAYYVSRVCITLTHCTVGTDCFQDNPLLLWRAECELFLEEFIRLEGRGCETTGRALRL